MFERGWTLRWQRSGKAGGAGLRSARSLQFSSFAEGRDVIEISLLLTQSLFSVYKMLHDEGYRDLETSVAFHPWEQGFHLEMAPCQWAPLPVLAASQLCVFLWERVPISVYLSRSHF